MLHFSTLIQQPTTQQLQREAQATQGTASITTIGGVTQAYATGNPNDINTTDNSGYQTTNYPAQDTDPKTAGIEMTVNTTGFSAL